MKAITKTSVLVLAILTAAALSACGGGDSASANATSPAAAQDTQTPAKPNTAPVANAGNDQSVVVGAKVTLNGSASSDADGDTLTYSWTLTSPAGSTAVLSSTTAATPTFVADVAGTYVATLVVNDGIVNSGPVTVQIKAAAAVAFDTLTPMPPAMTSYGLESSGLASIGDSIKLQPGSPRTVDTISIGMSSYACQNGSWDNATCTSAPNATFNVPITVNIYDSKMNLIASRTQAFDIPYRPSADPTCTNAGQWKAADGTCHYSFADKITFNLGSLKVTLPDDTLSFEVTYNTNTYGPNPIGKPGPYDSLNVGVFAPPTLPTVGTDLKPGYLLWNGVLAQPQGSSHNIMAQVTTVNP